MEQIKTNCREIIERGTEYKEKDIDRKGGIYAVCLGFGCDKRWGVVYFDHGTMRNFNVALSNRWADSLISEKGLHFFTPTAMEVTFVKNYQALNAANVRMKAQDYRLQIYENSKLHRIAESLRKFF